MSERRKSKLPSTTMAIIGLVLTTASIVYAMTMRSQAVEARNTANIALTRVSDLGDKISNDAIDRAVVSTKLDAISHSVELLRKDVATSTKMIMQHVMGTVSSIGTIKGGN